LSFQNQLLISSRKDKEVANIERKIVNNTKLDLKNNKFILEYEDPTIVEKHRQKRLFSYSILKEAAIVCQPLCA